LGIYDEVLEIFAKTNPGERAHTMTAIGNAHCQLPVVDRTDNLRKAVCLFDSALLVYT
jgi:hypothetical protein